MGNSRFLFSPQWLKIRAHLLPHNCPYFGTENTPYYVRIFARSIIDKYYVTFPKKLPPHDFPHSLMPDRPSDYRPSPAITIFNIGTLGLRFLSLRTIFQGFNSKYRNSNGLFWQLRHAWRQSFWAAYLLLDYLHFINLFIIEYIVLHAGVLVVRRRRQPGSNRQQQQTAGRSRPMTPTTVPPWRKRRRPSTDTALFAATSRIPPQMADAVLSLSKLISIASSSERCFGPNDIRHKHRSRSDDSDPPSHLLPSLSSSWPLPPIACCWLLYVAPGYDRTGTSMVEARRRGRKTSRMIRTMVCVCGEASSASRTT
jgi:hypothetical protein